MSQVSFVSGRRINSAVHSTTAGPGGSQVRPTPVPIHLGTADSAIVILLNTGPPPKFTSNVPLTLRTTTTTLPQGRPFSTVPGGDPHPLLLDCFEDVLIVEDTTNGGEDNGHTAKDSRRGEGDPSSLGEMKIRSASFASSSAETTTTKQMTTNSGARNDDAVPRARAKWDDLELPNHVRKSLGDISASLNGKMMGNTDPEFGNSLLRWSSDFLRELREKRLDDVVVAVVRILLKLEFVESNIRCITFTNILFGMLPSENLKLSIAIAETWGEALGIDGVNASFLKSISESALDQAVEWLELDVTTEKRVSGLLLIRQLTAKQPTLCTNNMEELTRVIRLVLKDVTPTVRELAAVVIRGLMPLLPRESRRATLSSICETASTALCSRNAFDDMAAAHASALVLSVYLCVIRYSSKRPSTLGSVLPSLPSYREITNACCQLRINHPQFMRTALLTLLPILADYDPEGFVANHLHDAMRTLITFARGATTVPDRAGCMFAIGCIAASVGLAPLWEGYIQEAVTPLICSMLMQRPRIEAAATCLALLSEYCPANLKDLMVTQIVACHDALFHSTVTPAVASGLERIVKVFPRLLPAFQERLLDDVHITLKGIPRCAALAADSSPALARGNPSFADASTSPMVGSSSTGGRFHFDDNIDLKLSCFRVLRSFDFRGQRLGSFFVSVCQPYFVHPDDDIRMEAVRVCKSLVLTDCADCGKVHHGETHRSLLASFVRELLAVIVTDPISDIRREALQVLSSNDFDVFLTSSRNIYSLFSAVNDPSAANAASAISVLERVIHKNPSIALPHIRTLLLRLLPEIQNAADVDTNSLSLLFFVIRAAPEQVPLYLMSILDICEKVLTHGSGTTAVSSAARGIALSIVGCLALREFLSSQGPDAPDEAFYENEYNYDEFEFLWRRFVNLAIKELTIEDANTSMPALDVLQLLLQRRPEMVTNFEDNVPQLGRLLLGKLGSTTQAASRDRALNVSVMRLLGLLHSLNSGYHRPQHDGHISSESSHQHHHHHFVGADVDLDSEVLFDTCFTGIERCKHDILHIQLSALKQEEFPTDSALYCLEVAGSLLADLHIDEERMERYTVELSTAAVKLLQHGPRARERVFSVFMTMAEYLTFDVLQFIMNACREHFSPEEPQAFGKLADFLLQLATVPRFHSYLREAAMFISSRCVAAVILWSGERDVVEPLIRALQLVDVLVSLNAGHNVLTAVIPALCQCLTQPDASAIFRSRAALCLTRAVLRGATAQNYVGKMVDAILWERKAEANPNDPTSAGGEGASSSTPVIFSPTSPMDTAAFTAADVSSAQLETSLPKLFPRLAEATQQALEVVPFDDLEILALMAVIFLRCRSATTPFAPSLIAHASRILEGVRSTVIFQTLAACSSGEVGDEVLETADILTLSQGAGKGGKAGDITPGHAVSSEAAPSSYPPTSSITPVVSPPTSPRSKRFIMSPETCSTPGARFRSFADTCSERWLPVMKIWMCLPQGDESWHSWFEQLGTELMKEAPISVLRRALPLVHTHSDMLRRLFPLALAACATAMEWDTCHSVSTQFEKVLSAVHRIPPDILLVLARSADAVRVYSSADTAEFVPRSLVYRLAVAAHSVPLAITYREYDTELMLKRYSSCVTTPPSTSTGTRSPGESDGRGYVIMVPLPPSVDQSGFDATSDPADLGMTLAAEPLDQDTLSPGPLGVGAGSDCSYLLISLRRRYHDALWMRAEQNALVLPPYRHFIPLHSPAELMGVGRCYEAYEKYEANVSNSPLGTSSTEARTNIIGMLRCLNRSFNFRGVLELYKQSPSWIQESAQVAEQVSLAALVLRQWDTVETSAANEPGVPQTMMHFLAVAVHKRNLVSAKKLIESLRTRMDQEAYILGCENPRQKHKFNLFLRQLSEIETGVDLLRQHSSENSDGSTFDAKQQTARFLISASKARLQPLPAETDTVNQLRTLALRSLFCPWESQEACLRRVGYEAILHGYGRQVLGWLTARDADTVLSSPEDLSTTGSPVSPTVFHDLGKAGSMSPLGCQVDPLLALRAELTLLLAPTTAEIEVSYQALTLAISCLSPTAPRSDQSTTGAETPAFQSQLFLQHANTALRAFEMSSQADSHIFDGSVPRERSFKAAQTNPATNASAIANVTAAPPGLPLSADDANRIALASLQSAHTCDPQSLEVLALFARCCADRIALLAPRAASTMTTPDAKQRRNPALATTELEFPVDGESTPSPPRAANAPSSPPSGTADADAAAPPSPPLSPEEAEMESFALNALQAIRMYFQLQFSQEDTLAASSAALSSDATQSGMQSRTASSDPAGTAATSLPSSLSSTRAGARSNPRRGSSTLSITTSEFSAQPLIRARQLVLLWYHLANHVRSEAGRRECLSEHKLPISANVCVTPLLFSEAFDSSGRDDTAETAVVNALLDIVSSEHHQALCHRIVVTIASRRRTPFLSKVLNAVNATSSASARGAMEALAAIRRFLYSSKEISLKLSRPIYFLHPIDSHGRGGDGVVKLERLLESDRTFQSDAAAGGAASTRVSSAVSSPVSMHPPTSPGSPTSSFHPRDKQINVSCTVKLTSSTGHTSIVHVEEPTQSHRRTTPLILCSFAAEVLAEAIADAEERIHVTSTFALGPDLVAHERVVAGADRSLAEICGSRVRLEQLEALETSYESLASDTHGRAALLEDVWADPSTNEFGTSAVRDALKAASTMASRWLEVRSYYVRHMAQWSAIHYLLGTRDRSAESLRINTSRGIVVHTAVSANSCGSSRLLEPVPFRLTPALVKAMELGSPFGSFHGSLVTYLSRALVFQRAELKDIVKFGFVLCDSFPSVSFTPVLEKLSTARSIRQRVPLHVDTTAVQNWRTSDLDFEISEGPTSTAGPGNMSMLSMKSESSSSVPSRGPQSLGGTAYFTNNTELVRQDDGAMAPRSSVTQPVAVVSSSTPIALGGGGGGSLGSYDGGGVEGESCDRDDLFGALCDDLEETTNHRLVVVQRVARQWLAHRRELRLTAAALPVSQQQQMQLKLRMQHIKEHQLTIQSLVSALVRDATSLENIACQPIAWGPQW